MLNALLDMVFPPVCLLCAKDLGPDGFCAACRGAISDKIIRGARCSVCSIPFASEAGSDHVCGECLKTKNHFIKACSAVIYDGIVHEAIQAFKYNGKVALAGPLAGLASDAMDFPEAPEIIVPVPLHINRLRKRGYNQALLIARIVAKRMDVAVDYMSLKRVRDTASQVNLKAAERQGNISGAFAVRRTGALDGKRVLLVDDVFTTGATLRECAKVLNMDGARVYALTIARVP